MLDDPLHWFPDPYFSTFLFILVVLIYLADLLAPQLARRGQSSRPKFSRDRGSFMLIQAFILAGILSAITLRKLNWGLLPGGMQYFGLLFIPLGLFVRTWAIVRLGRYFSSVVEIETAHQLITAGPYRWLRHPAYTGMLTVHLGIGLALGSGPGAAVMFVLLAAATFYRIHVEEKVLVQAFRDEYRCYMQHTWRLFPGW
jgi:protein-S-isoprenylcysteine O-methyltransferase